MARTTARTTRKQSAAASEQQQQPQQQTQTENVSEGDPHTEVAEQPTEKVVVSPSPGVGATAAAAAMTSPHLEGNGRGTLEIVGDITMTRNVEILKW